MKNIIKNLTVILVITIIIISSAVGTKSFAKEAVNRKHKKIIQKELSQPINNIECIDKYKKGKWFVYYIYADGDVYIITIKNNKIDVKCQLN